MIQDIFPYFLDNQFKDEHPKDDDVIFFFQGSSLLGKEEESGAVSYPTYREFVQGYSAEADRFVVDDFEFVYLLSLKKSDITEKRFFLAMPVHKLDKGEFIGEMADSAVHDEYKSYWDGYEFIGVNKFRVAKPKETAYASITAFHLYGWYRDNRFCGRCGHLMKHGDKERMMFCPDCKNTVFPKICPAVIVAVTNGNKILLTKYAGRTYKNYALVAGFTEIGETVEQTVIREVKEEVGLDVKNLKYYKSQPWGLSGSLLYGYFCEVDGDTSITLQEDELSVGKWVSADELDTDDDGISLTREMIVKFARENKAK
jgi:NAD+ diphosphatase